MVAQGFDSLGSSESKHTQMKKFISSLLMILAIIHLIGCLCALFHVGSNNLNNLTYDRLAAAFMVIGCFYAYVSLRIVNQTTHK